MEAIWNSVIFKHLPVIDILVIFYENSSHEWHRTSWDCQTTNYCLNKSWPTSVQCRMVSLGHNEFKNGLSKCGGWFNTKMPSNQNRKSHCGDATILQPSYSIAEIRPAYLHNGISYTYKMASLHWIRAQVLPLHPKLTARYCELSEATGAISSHHGASWKIEYNR